MSLTEKIIIIFITIMILANSMFGLTGGKNNDLLSLFRKTSILSDTESRLYTTEGNDRGVIGFGAAENIYTLIEMYEKSGNKEHLDASVNYIKTMIECRDDRRNVVSYMNNLSMPVILPVWRLLSASSFYIGSQPKDSHLSESSFFIRRFDGKGKRINNQYEDRYFSAPYLVQTANIVLCMTRFAHIMDKYNKWMDYGIERDSFISEIALSIDAHDKEWIDYNGNEIYGWLDNSDIEETFWRLQYHGRCLSEEPVSVNHFCLMGSALISMYELTGRDKYRYKAYHLAESFRNILGIDDNNAYYWKHRYHSPQSDIHSEDLAHSRVSWRFIFDYYNSSINEDFPVFNETDINRLVNTFMMNIFIGDTSYVKYAGKTDSFTVNRDSIYDLNAFISGESWSNNPSFDINSGRKRAIYWIPLCKYEPRIYEIAYNICSKEQYRGIKNLLYYAADYKPCKIIYKSDNALISIENIEILGNLKLYIECNGDTIDSLSFIRPTENNEWNEIYVFDQSVISSGSRINIHYFSDNEGIKGPLKTETIIMQK